MASRILTPKEVETQKANLLNPQMEKLRQEINKALLNPEGLGCYLNVDSYPQGVIEKVMDECRRAGWPVRLDQGNDPRDQSSWKTIRITPPLSDSSNPWDR